MQARSLAVKSALIMACSSSVLMFGYEMIRSASNSLFKQAFGVENLAVAMAFIPFVLLPMLYFYNFILNSQGPKKTFLLSGLLSCIAILICYFGLLLESKFAAGLLYLVRESYVILIIEQMWSFINSILSKNDAKKYNGFILAISSIGAIIGGLSVHFLTQSLGCVHLLLLAALSCLPTIFVGNYAFSTMPESSVKTPKKSRFAGDHLGIKLFKKEKVLFLILFMVLSSQVYSTIVTLNFQTVIQEYSPSLDRQTSISGLFFAMLHIVSLIFQLIGTPLVLSLISISTVHIVIPIIHMLSALLVFFFPGLWSAGISLILFKSIDYSIFRVAKEILYIPLTFDARFRAKELIDVFGYRFSKSGASLIIGTLQKFGVYFSTTSYGFVGFLSAFGWIAFVAPILKSKRKPKKIKAPI